MSFLVLIELVMRIRQMRYLYTACLISFVELGKWLLLRVKS
jgi:hypothetical protein